MNEAVDWLWCTCTSMSLIQMNYFLTWIASHYLSQDTTALYSCNRGEYCCMQCTLACTCNCYTCMHASSTRKLACMYTAVAVVVGVTVVVLRLGDYLDPLALHHLDSSLAWSGGTSVLIVTVDFTAVLTTIMLCMYYVHVHVEVWRCDMYVRTFVTVQWAQDMCTVTWLCKSSTVKLSSQ